MAEKFVWVLLLQYAVGVLLLCATYRLCQNSWRLKNICLAAGVSAVYGAFCTLDVCRILLYPGCRIVCIALTLWIAFGLRRSAVCDWAIYLLLNVAVGSITVSANTDKMWGLLAAAASICVICMLIPNGLPGECVPVEIKCGDLEMKLTALRDTGNMLKDPITGKPVLVVDGDTARKLTGLSPKQLRSPMETICAGIIPGLRLIPYKTIGASGGFMLAMKFQNVRIGSWKGSSLIAFAPEKIGSSGKYQALTGGVL